MLHVGSFSLQSPFILKSVTQHNKEADIIKEEVSQELAKQNVSDSDIGTEGNRAIREKRLNELQGHTRQSGTKRRC